MGTNTDLLNIRQQNNFEIYQNSEMFVTPVKTRINLSNCYIICLMFVRCKCSDVIIY